MVLFWRNSSVIKRFYLERSVKGAKMVIKCAGNFWFSLYEFCEFLWIAADDVLPAVTAVSNSSFPHQYSLHNIGSKQSNFH